jgi:hypothetical protein
MLPAAIAIGGLAASAIGGIAQAISGASRTSKAKRALENYQRQELRNITEGMRVSTLGAQLNTREAQRRFATSVDALRSGGVRGVVGGLGAQEQLMQNQQASIAAELDRQQVMIERMRAQDEARIRAMQEQRESQEISGLGSEIAAGRQLTQAGISGIMNTGLSASMMASDGAFDGLFAKKNKTEFKIPEIGTTTITPPTPIRTNLQSGFTSGFTPQDYSGFGSGMVPQTPQIGSSFMAPALGPLQISRPNK